MRILGVIPARYASTRFPGKPLVEIQGISMIQRVYEQALKASKLDEVVVATDDDRILTHVRSFGGRVILTADTHQSGTDRCAEVAKKLPGFEVIVNIQGDEPFIDPRQIDLVCSCFQSGDTSLATLIKRISNFAELENTNSPKVIINSNSDAIYFSRTPIPFIRNNPGPDLFNSYVFYKHIGIYGYRINTLFEITQLPVSSLEKAEALEQLRWIENGYRIKVAETDIETLAIDTPEDLKNYKFDQGN